MTAIPETRMRKPECSFLRKSFAQENKNVKLELMGQNKAAF